VSSRQSHRSERDAGVDLRVTSIGRWASIPSSLLRLLLWEVGCGFVIREGPHASGATRVSKIRVVHIINSFEHGGAEAMLCNLLLRTDTRRFEASVVSLIDDLTVAGPILNAGIPLVTMGMRPGIPDPRTFLRLAKHLRKLQPAVVQTWMDHSNLIGGLAARMATRAKVVWGIHHSNHVKGVAKRSTLATVAACGKLSRRVPSRIICVSEHASRLYAQHGFAAKRFTVIPNGFDTALLRPDPSARQSVREELGLCVDAPLVGLVARHDPFKDHDTFFRAAGIMAKQRPDVHFLLCGAGVDSNNSAITGQINQLGIAAHCHLLGPRRDMPRIHASLDICTSSSISEAFPLVLGEAMACGVPCVATDVGDSALILGDTGKVVPPRDPAALAAGWAALLSIGAAARAELGIAARRRVIELFDLTSVTRRYEAIYDSVISSQHTATDGHMMQSPDAVAAA
jgi:glycosyltransferase involved in cell wall biosynthesis